jgi:hypothetical protein
VLSAGVAPPDARADEASDCIARALRSLRLGALAKGQRGPAKVSVVIR